MKGWENTRFELRSERVKQKKLWKSWQKSWHVAVLTEPCAIAPTTNTIGSSAGTRSRNCTRFVVWNEVPGNEDKLHQNAVGEEPQKTWWKYCRPYQCYTQYTKCITSTHIDSIAESFCGMVPAIAWPFMKTFGDDDKASGPVIEHAVQMNGWMNEWMNEWMDELIN